MSIGSSSPADQIRPSLALNNSIFAPQYLPMWDFLRPEDRTNRNLVWPSVGGEEVDLENVFELNTTEKDVSEVFV